MQPNPNPSNKATQSIDDLVTFQTYLITPIGLNEVHLRSEKVIKPEYTPIITEEECESPRKDIVDSETTITPVAASAGKPVVSTTYNPSRDGALVIADSTFRAQDPPYPQRLIETRSASQTESEFLKELKKLYVRIPLLQSLKEVPIYAKMVRYLCVKKPRRKLKDPAIIHVMGKMSKLMIDRPLLTKYNDPGNPTVAVHIDDQPITNTLIDLGASISVMTKDLFISLGLPGTHNA